MKRFARFSVLGMVALVGSASESSPAKMAWPQVLIWHGSGLQAPVSIAGLDQVMQFMSSIQGADTGSSQQLARRHSYEVALFWDPSLRSCSLNPECVARLSPADAEHTARYYPRWGGEPAVWLEPFEASPPATLNLGNSQVRRIGDVGLRMLEERGIPINARH
jgi:hypothetical protein